MSGAAHIGAAPLLYLAFAAARAMIAPSSRVIRSVPYTPLRAHETGRNLVCRLLLEKKNSE